MRRARGRETREGEGGGSRRVRDRIEKKIIRPRSGVSPARKVGSLRSISRLGALVSRVFARSEAGKARRETHRGGVDAEGSLRDNDGLRRAERRGGLRAELRLRAVGKRGVSGKSVSEGRGGFRARGRGRSRASRARCDAARDATARAWTTWHRGRIIARGSVVLARSRVASRARFPKRARRVRAESDRT